MKLRVLMYPTTNPKNISHGIVADSVRATGEAEVIPYSFGGAFISRFDVFHVHWPDAIVFPAPRWRVLVKFVLFTSFLVITHLRGKPIVWTAHNMGSHEGRFPILEKLLWRLFFSVVDHIIHYCPQGIDALREWRGGDLDVPQSVIAHPNFRCLYPDLPSRTLARSRLGLPENEKIYLTFGMLRRYKGIEALVEGFKAWTEQDDARLIIAGEATAGDGLDQILEDAAASDRRMILHRGFIDDATLVDLIRACDIVVIPTAKVLNSGVANMALAFDRPILAYPFGCIVDYRNRLGESWVVFINGSLTEALSQSWTTILEHVGTEDRVDLHYADPDRIGAMTLGVYHTVLGNRA